MKTQTKKYIALGMIFIIIHLLIFILYQLALPGTAYASEESKVSALQTSIDAPNWTSQKTATVQIVIADPYQVGVKRVEYKIGSGKWTDAPADLKVPVASDCNLSVRATDSFDAVAITNKYLQCFDLTAPNLISVHQQGDNVVIAATDAQSGVYSIVVNAVEYVCQADGSASIAAATLKTSALDVQVKDVAGNISDVSSFTLNGARQMLTVAPPPENSTTPIASPENNTSPASIAEETTDLLVQQPTSKTPSFSLDGILSGKGAEAKAKKQSTPMDGLINTVLIFAVCAAVGFGYIVIKNKRSQKEHDDKDFIMYEDDSEKEMDSFDGGIVYEA